MTSAVFTEDQQAESVDVSPVLTLFGFWKSVKKIIKIKEFHATSRRRVV